MNTIDWSSDTTKRILVLYQLLCFQFCLEASDFFSSYRYGYGMGGLLRVGLPIIDSNKTPNLMNMGSKLQKTHFSAEKSYGSSSLIYLSISWSLWFIFYPILCILELDMSMIKLIWFPLIPLSFDWSKPCPKLSCRAAKQPQVLLFQFWDSILYQAWVSNHIWF